MTGVWHIVRWFWLAGHGCGDGRHVLMAALFLGRYLRGFNMLAVRCWSLSRRQALGLVPLAYRRNVNSSLRAKLVAPLASRCSLWLWLAVWDLDHLNQTVSPV